MYEVNYNVRQLQYDDDDDDDDDDICEQLFLLSYLTDRSVIWGDRPNPPDTTPEVMTPLFAAVRESVRVRNPPRGSDRVRSKG